MKAHHVRIRKTRGFRVMPGRRTWHVRCCCGIAPTTVCTHAEAVSAASHHLWFESLKGADNA